MAQSRVLTMPHAGVDVEQLEHSRITDGGGKDDPAAVTVLLRYK